MKKLFCLTMLCVAFSAIGSQRGTPIQEYFGPARFEQPKGPQPTRAQPIRHSFGSDEPDPLSVYQDTSPTRSKGQGKSETVQPKSNPDKTDNK
jgi:hypothetical protein